MKKYLLSGVVALTLAGSAAPLASANDWRDDNPHARWDTSRDNGYWMNNQWHYGAAPRSYVGKPGFAYGWHDWHKGDRIPASVRSHYRVVDYRSHHLRQPPRGYHWVQDDKGNVILAAIATGLIADLIINSH